MLRMVVLSQKQSHQVSSGDLGVILPVISSITTKQDKIIQRKFDITVVARKSRNFQGQLVRRQLGLRVNLNPRKFTPVDF